MEKSEFIQTLCNVPLVELSLDEKPDLMDGCIIDLADDMPEPFPLISIGDVPLFTRGNISTIGGKAKSRKTFLIIHLASKFLDENLDLSVLLIDTEMSKFHTIKTARRIHRLTGWDEHINNARLHVLCLRENSPSERVDVLKQALTRFNPDIIFIDGIRDLVRDFNNPEESSDMVNLLMRLSSQSNCHICSVLHENKLGGQLRGHLGSEIINKSETVISVETTGMTTTVKPLFTRNMSFDEFHFQINSDSLPELCEAEIQAPNTEKMKDLFRSVLAGTSSIAYAELSRRLQEKTGTTDRTCEKKIKEGIEKGVIEKNKVGYYIMKQDEPIDDTLPF